jgi:hypothetical protein
MDEYLNTLPPHRRVLTERTLNVLVKFNTLGIMTRGEMVEHYHKQGKLEPVCETEVVPVGRSWEHYKRASSKGIELDSYLEQLTKEKSKVHYSIRGYKVNKTVYDYAVYLLKGHTS